jgi:hypothetical protein
MGLLCTAPHVPCTTPVEYPHPYLSCPGLAQGGRGAQGLGRGGRALGVGWWQVERVCGWGACLVAKASDQEQMLLLGQGQMPMEDGLLAV